MTVLIIFFLADSKLFCIAPGTSLAFPSPTPTLPLPSPTTEIAEKLNLRPPLTTLATLEIRTTVSINSCSSSTFSRCEKLFTSFTDTLCSRSNFSRGVASSSSVWLDTTVSLSGPVLASSSIPVVSPTGVSVVPAFSSLATSVDLTSISHIYTTLYGRRSASLTPSANALTTP